MKEALNVRVVSFAYEDGRPVMRWAFIQR